MFAVFIYAYVLRLYFLFRFKGLQTVISRMTRHDGESNKE